MGRRTYPLYYYLRHLYEKNHPGNKTMFSMRRDIKRDARDQPPFVIRHRLPMPGRTTAEDPASVRECVSTYVPRILDQAQISTANHQKNLVALYKIQAEAAQYVEYVKKGKGFKPVGEKIFEDCLLQMLVRVLPMKKGTPQADRVVRFVGGFIKFINEKGVFIFIDSYDLCE